MDYDSLREKYDRFLRPLIEIEVNGKSITSGTGKTAVGISNVNVDLSAGFEASQATFNIYNVYNYEKAEFNFNTIKKFVVLGSAVKIYAGYEKTVTEIFTGVIVKMNFVVEEGDVGHVEVTCMDVKAVMMANRYSRRLKASTYGDAVKEIFDQNIYQSMKNSGVIEDIKIDNTPDKPPAGAGAAGGDKDTDRTIEMVGESDYEFLVKVARKFNFDFFVLAGIVYFRQAKSDQTKQITITPKAKIVRLSVEYDMTGLVESIEVRGLDVGKAKVVTEKKKNSYKLSQGNKAKALISGSKFVYIDPTVSNSSDAGSRANYLFEEMTHRYGTLELDMVGIPEITPGRYITISDVGTAVSNDFYVQTVKHIFTANGRYTTRIIGKTNQMSSGGLF